MKSPRDLHTRIPVWACPIFYRNNDGSTLVLWTFFSENSGHGLFRAQEGCRRRCDLQPPFYNFISIKIMCKKLKPIHCYLTMCYLSIFISESDQQAFLAMLTYTEFITLYCKMKNEQCLYVEQVWGIFRRMREEVNFRLSC